VAGSHRIDLPSHVLVERRDLWFILVSFLAGHLLIAACGFLSAQHFHAGPLLDAMCRWDCSWYQNLFEHGYDLAPNSGPGGPASPHAHVVV